MGREERNQKRVKIAILDTGINAKNPLVTSAIAAKRIKKMKSFVPGADDHEDVSGHGTHAAMLINKVAPEAEIYVARVFEDSTTVTDQYIRAVRESDHVIGHGRC